MFRAFSPPPDLTGQVPEAAAESREGTRHLVAVATICAGGLLRSVNLRRA